MKRLICLFIFLLSLTSCAKKEVKTSSLSYNAIDNNLTIIEWKDIFLQKEDQYYCFVFSNTCKYCTLVEPDIMELSKKNRIYKIEFNESVPLKDISINFIGISNLEDLYILGTPTLFEIASKVISNSYIGAKQIQDFMTSYKETS